MKELTEKEALHKTAAYCSAAEHCLSEVKERLDTWGIPSEQQKNIIEYLVKEQYINEERYAYSFVNDKFRINKWGRNKIKQGLQIKGIMPETSRKALESINTDEYILTLRQLLNAKNKSIKTRNDYDRYGKLIRFATGKGYEQAIIKQCLSNDEYEYDYDMDKSPA